jgi:very-short-patch-repair endonuclease
VVIELDGGQHTEPGLKARDESRTRWLESQGYQVLRFWNDDVLEPTSGVVDVILEVLSEEPPPPNLPH